jgi:16S rRNA pseudouridine516 synthase
MRLDKYLANVSAYSRSDAKKLLKAGRVTVDGKRVTEPRCEVDVTAVVAVDGESLRPPTKRFYMLNKPVGYVSATKDREHLTVLDLLDEDNCERLHIAGRLDMDTTGLVLITDDGGWSHRVTAPKSDCKKTYYIELYEALTEEAISQIEQGIHLDNEKRPTLPASLEKLDDYSCRLTISEGKYHQVKRMFVAVGNNVEKLHRERIGDIVLDDSLSLGEYRALTEQEINSV